MGFIEGAEWIVVVMATIAFCFCLYLVVSVQGDMRPEESGWNTNEQAKQKFIDLLNQTRRQIDIHDDGSNLPDSIYNSPEVIDTIRDRIQESNISIRCLFNDADEPLKLLELACSEKYSNNVEIWYLNGGRQEPDTHYKIVDRGRFVHISNYEQGSNERWYRLRKAPGWWENGTRKRISKKFIDHFEHGLKNSVQAG